MPHHDAFDEGDLESWEEPDQDSREELDTVPCPYCGKSLYEDAERCPYCENYISREDAPVRHTAWFALGVVVCLAIVACWIIGC